MKKKSKGEKQILFLDFDGVLNNIAYFLTTDKTVDMFLDVKTTFKGNMDIHNVKILNYILDKLPKVEVIISSAWGKRYSLAEIKTGLKYAGLKKEHTKRLVDITPKKMSSNRCNEVKWAVDDLIEEGWYVAKWLTLDDNRIFPESKDPNDVFGQHVQREITTSKLYGVTIVDAWKIIKYFDPNFKQPEVYL